MKRFPLNHIWFFLTDRCNLRCGYCFFRNKTNRHVVSPRIIRGVMDFTRSFGTSEFILSGGEPLLDWVRTRGMIREIRQQYPRRYISVQSNATLLDQYKVALFRKYGVNMEVGIDGDEETHVLNRPGAGNGYYQKVCRAMERLKAQRISSSTTMTVHPGGAGKLFQNLLHLDRLGARRIEIHPAFLEHWDALSARLFLKGYRQASAYALREKKMGLIGRGYSQVSARFWDMVILPDGKVLPNWTFLSFPEGVRRHYYIMDFSTGQPKVLPAARAYFDLLDRFRAAAGPGGATYRQISNFNAGLALGKADPKFLKGFGVYLRLCQDVEKIDQDVMRKALCRQSVMNQH